MTDKIFPKEILISICHDDTPSFFITHESLEDVVSSNGDCVEVAYYQLVRTGTVISQPKFTPDKPVKAKKNA